MIVRGLIFLFCLLLGISFSTRPIHDGPLSLLTLRKSLEPLAYLEKEKLSLVFFDLSRQKGLSINAKKAMNPASVIKLPILIEAYRQIQEGRLSPKTELILETEDRQMGSGTLRYQPIGTRVSVIEAMRLMIEKSDNTATKLLIDHLGIESLNQGFQDMGLSQTRIGTTDLLDAEGRNYASADDIASLLKQISQGSFLSERSRAEMLNTLSSQIYRWGIPKYLPASLVVANKTGTLRHVSHDVGLVFHERPYILVLFVSNVESYQSARQLIARVSERVYHWVERAEKP